MGNSIVFCGDWLPGTGGTPQPGHVCIGNLECAFSDLPVKTYKAYPLVVPTVAMADVAESSFTALSLANNHVCDAGNFSEMYALLQKCCPRIVFFGTADTPYARLTISGERIAVIGCLEPCRSRGPGIFPEEKVAPLIVDLKKRYSRVYVYPHWGKESEYTRYPSPRQIKLAHQWVERGADGIYGHHAHVYQGMEVYRGVEICYSLGNWFFPHAESGLYDGTAIGLSVEVDWQAGRGLPLFHQMASGGPVPLTDGNEAEKLKTISSDLSRMGYWLWSKRIGAFFIKKNMASWRLRLRRNFWKTLPIFLVWQILPSTVLFRIASWFSFDSE